MGGGRKFVMPKMCEKYEKGMITVEASFIIPMICMLLVLVISFYFFCFESGVAAGIVREETEKLSDTIKTSGDLQDGNYNIYFLNQRKLSYLFNYESGTLESKCKSNIKTRMEKASLFGDHKHIELEIKHGEIRGKITNDINIFHVEETTVGTVRIPAEQIRRWQQIE